MCKGDAMGRQVGTEKTLLPAFCRQINNRRNTREPEHLHRLPTDYDQFPTLNILQGQIRARPPTAGESRRERARRAPRSPFGRWLYDRALSVQSSCFSFGAAANQFLNNRSRLSQFIRTPLQLIPWQREQTRAYQREPWMRRTSIRGSH